MVLLPLERALPYEDALDLLTNDLRGLGLTPFSTTVGRSITSTKCILLDDAGTPADFGYGKGSKVSSAVGAAFEAAEHYFSQPRHIEFSKLEFVRVADFLRSTLLRSTRALETLSLTPAVSLPFRRYRGLTSSTEALYPLALTCPRYIDELLADPTKFDLDQSDYGSLQRYSTNSGVAIGATEEEAIIHGILEAVERDTLSAFLVSTFLFPRKSKIRLVDTATLPKHIEAVFRDVCCEVGSKVLLVEMPNEFGIPTFYASLPDSSFPIDVAGFGSSLSRDHAALRSLHELVQCFHITTVFHPDSVETRDKQVLENFSQHPFHRRCAQLKLAAHFRKYGFVKVSYQETATQDDEGTVINYLNQLLTIMAKKGREVFSSKIISLPSGLTVTHSFIDGQDHFFCVTEGALVLPNGWFGHLS